jgi:dynein heavy chain
VESEHLRKENDLSGPQDELEYWKRRGAQFSQIVTHIQGHEVSKLEFQKGACMIFFI